MVTTLVTAACVRSHRGIEGDAILVEDGVVLGVGSRDRLPGRAGHEHRYPGSIVVPGIRDAHFHPVAYTAAVGGLTLGSARDIADVLDAVRVAAGELPPGAPVVGLRLDDESLTERRLPTAAELDRAAPSRPVVLHRYCGHVAVANHAALALGGITAATSDPIGGVIDRNAAGAPTGVLRETAIDAVSAALPPGASAVTPAGVARALRGLAALGITSIGAMVRRGEGAWASLGNETEILAAAGPDIPIKVRAYVIADTAEQLLDAGTRLGAAGPRVRWQGLKRFGDGSFGGHTAAMHLPFADRPTTGTLRLAASDEALAIAALDAGKDVAIHAIGDLAVTRTVDLMETLRRLRPRDGRLRIEHVSVILPADVARMASLGILASVQPPFMGSETHWIEGRVGADRLPMTYAFRTMADAGITLAGGSDCPVEKPDPWSGMALARDRAGVYPSEALSAEAAFVMYTAGGAAALGEPEPLAVGSPADFVVVDRDPVTATPDLLRNTRVLATYVDGIPVDISGGELPWPG